MNIQHHIRNLLYRNDCVIVEGFGAFVCQRQSARLEEGIIFPPRKVVNFNSSLKTDDGLLANHIAIQEKVSFQIARQHIGIFSNELLEKLHSDKSLNIRSLGNFLLSKDETILFHPDQNHDWLLEAYGLPSLQPTILEKDTIVENEEEPVVPVLQINERKRASFWKYAAVGIAAIGILSFSGLEIYKNDVEKHNFTQTEKAKEIVNRTIQESSFVINDPLTPLTVEVQLEQPKGRFHIIAGAFRVQENAEKRILQLRERGFQSHYLGENKYGLHQVAYNSYTSKKDALKALRTIKKKNNPGAWLFVKEL